MPIAVAPGAAGDLIPAKAGGPLPGTRLTSFRLVEGGWAAVVVDDEGIYNADKYVAAIPAIAAKYRMHRSMITILPDAGDETRCEIFAQRTSPIRDTIYWPGPASVDGPAGRALFATYADGNSLYYEIYRRRWGCPHDAFYGSTGCGKSQAVCMCFVIDRWAHYIGPDGKPVGMVASALIDHQEGQSYAPFLDDLALPVAVELPEAIMMVEAFHREAKRRNRFLAREARWHDPKRDVWRVGRDWWDPLVDGPILTLTVDEAHEPLRDRKFAEALTSGSRMWRKCGMKVRLATQMSVLSDVGGSTALRDMLLGGFVWNGKSNNGLTGALALNGRLRIDPRHIPDVPGTAAILPAGEPRDMLARTCWMEDWYDAIRDLNNEPIGYPAEIPDVTWDAFGDEFCDWARQKRANPFEPWIPPQREQIKVAPAADPKCKDVVLRILVRAALDAEAGTGPAALDANGLDEALKKQGDAYAPRTVREARKALVDDGKVVESAPGSGEWMATDDAVAALREQFARVAA